MYPLEYLNKINCSGLPLAKLSLKVGCPVMVLQNINPGDGVCNGSYGILTCHELEVQLLSGEHAGERQELFLMRPKFHSNLNVYNFPFDYVLLTINKSQGQSVNYVGIDARSAVFTDGQFHVLISRVISVHNIKKHRVINI